jgi:hypothetical protein
VSGDPGRFENGLYVIVEEDWVLSLSFLLYDDPQTLARQRCTELPSGILIDTHRPDLPCRPT